MTVQPPSLRLAEQPGDVVLGNLREKLNRLFSGVQVKTLAKWGQFAAIEIAFFGSEASLVAHGLLTANMLESLPPCGVKAFSPDRGFSTVHVRRRKTGIRMKTMWWIRSDDCKWKAAPAWIRSELHELAKIYQETDMATADELQPRQVSPDEWRAHALGRIDGLQSIFRIAFAPIDPAFTIDAEDLRRYQHGAEDLFDHLRRLISEIKICPASGMLERRLHLVVDNT